MIDSDLQKLNAAVECMLAREDFSANVGRSDKWYVIGQNVPHEFIPEAENMTVVSFHTCRESELEEIACETGGKRCYEGVGDS